jgi:acyl carrier protein
MITPEAIKIKLLEVCMDVDPSLVTYDITFNELKLDSMDIAALMLEVEEACHKKIPGTKLQELNTINRLTEFINAV